MNNTDKMDELLTLAIRDLIRKEWEDMASADVSEVKKNPKFRRMQKKVTTMIRNGPGKDKKPYRSKRKRWLPALIAAGLLLLLLAGPVVAAVIGNTTPGDIISRFGEKLFHLEYDTPVEIEGITFIKMSNHETYDNLDTFLKSEGMQILFPEYLPESVFLDEIICFKKSGKTKVVLAFHDAALSYTINEAGYDFSTVNDFGREIRMIDGTRTEMLILETSDGFEAAFDYDGLQYIICYKSMDELEKIIDGLRLRYP